MKQRLKLDDPARNIQFVEMNVDRARRLLQTANMTEPKSHKINSGISDITWQLARHAETPIPYNPYARRDDNVNNRLRHLQTACDELAAGILYSLQGYNTTVDEWTCSEVTGHDFTSGTIERQRYRVCDRCRDHVLIPKEEREKLFPKRENETGNQ